MKHGLRSAIADGWRLTFPYFHSSNEKWSARGLLVAIIAMNLTLVGLSVLLNSWNGQWFNSLQNKDATAFTELLLWWHVGEDGFMPGFSLIVAVYIPIWVVRTYLRELLILRWRRWMTGSQLFNWLNDRAYYTIGLLHAPGRAADDGTDNPDQRIAEDVRDFTDYTLTYGLQFLSTVVSMLSFARILYTLSGSAEIFGLTITGYLFWVALIYAIVGTWLTHLIGRRLIPLEVGRQRLEADFRFGLIRVRENAEGIALYQGERVEGVGLMGRFAQVFTNARLIIIQRMKLNALTFGYEQVASIFPYVVASPRYFAGQIALGGLTRTASAFSQVQNALSWFIELYQTLAQWRATVQRLTRFSAAVAMARRMAEGGVKVEPGGGSVLDLSGMHLALPDGRTLLDGGPALPAGHSTVLSGRSGSGKSTLFRAVAGIWPFGAGTVRRPEGSMLFLPQRAYIPLGTLRRAVTYPAPPEDVPDEHVRDALEAVGLGALLPELDAEENWPQRLSGGEQQRLAVARALLQRPDWLFLDEATASLDPEGEAALYGVLKRRLPDTTILSIAHRPEVARWHESGLELKEGALAPV